MAQPVIQTSFNAGEWAPALNARVDLAKYHSGAALLQNFFVDYRGGATTRPGSRYIQQCLLPATGITQQARLIPFLASLDVNYVIEVGAFYMRFYNNGAPVLEGGQSIAATTSTNPVVINTAGVYNPGDWLYVSGSGSPTQLNGNTYVVHASLGGGNYSLYDLHGNPVDGTLYAPWSAGSFVQRVYTISTPYLGVEVFGLKYAQIVNQLYLNHPNHPPYILTLNTAVNWTLAPAVFGPTIPTPTGTGIGTTLAVGSVNYAYVVTAVDVNGQESSPTAPITLANYQDLRSTPGTITVAWSAVAGAVSYNVYKAEPRYTNPVPSGAQYGFVGNLTGVIFHDSNIDPDFSQGLPILQNPFAGASIQSIIINNPGSYAGNLFPLVTLSGGAPQIAGVLQPYVYIAVIGIVAAGNQYKVGDYITITNGASVQVTSINAFTGAVTGFAVVNYGAPIYSGSIPANPVASSSPNGTGATFSLAWELGINLVSPGTGYSSTPSVVISNGGASATAVLGAPSNGNPTVPGFFQQRLVLAGQVQSPAQFNMSQPGAYLNFNVTDPVEPDNAIQGTLVSGQLNSIKSLIPMPAGLIALTNTGAWLINGGSAGSGVSATSIVANPQAYNGANDIPPVIADTDIIYVQAKGSVIRNLVYNFYTNVYQGADITILSSHLFYGYQIIQIAWAHEPFKLVWAVRSDGTALSLTHVKDQEMLAWAHSVTQGQYVSVCSIPELVNGVEVDAVYWVVTRTINGVPYNYVERFVELTYPVDYKSSWQVDAGIGYNGPAATTFQGAQHLAGLACVGLADGVPISFTMPATGIFVFGPGGTPGLTNIASASIVVVGLQFTPALQTLALDLGEPTVQGKRKKISAVTVRCANALGLSIGSAAANVVPMKDLVLGNLGTMTNTTVTGLVTGDARTIIDPTWTVQGQYYITQPFPYPASILGVIPEVTVGDTPK